MHIIFQLKRHGSIIYTNFFPQNKIQIDVRRNKENEEAWGDFHHAWAGAINKMSFLDSL